MCIDDFRDPVPLYKQTLWWMWSGGLLAAFEFGETPEVTLIAIVFSLCSLVGLECTGHVLVLSPPLATLRNLSSDASRTRFFFVGVEYMAWSIEIV